MQKLKKAILSKGKAINQDVLLVDSFLNHQVDVALMKEVGESFAEYFKDRGITRIVTIESSGIAPAAFTDDRCFLYLLKFSMMVVTPCPPPQQEENRP